MRPVFFATALLLSPLCAAAPKEIPLVLIDAPAPVPGREIADYQTAADSIVRVLTRKLQLPVPRYTMAIYPVREEFEAALIEHLKLKPEVARGAASFAKAAVGNRRVLVNENAMATLAWPERLITLSHETVHASQLELSGNRSLTRYQWLVEGFAEWIAFQVTQELGVNELRASRESMVTKVRAVNRKKGLVPLAQMDSIDQWISVRSNRGFDATYPFVFLVLDFLVERHSYARVLDYFRRHRDSSDSAANFSAAFGEGLPAFQAALDGHLARLLE